MPRNASCPAAFRLAAADTRWPLLIAALVLAGACDEQAVHDPAIEVREPAPLFTGREQQARLCGRGRSDLVIDLFCTDPPPAIDSLAALRAALGLASNANTVDQGFALTAHSTSLSARSVSAINPRVIFIRLETKDAELLTLAFARGERFVELAVRDRAARTLQFYLLSFTLACGDACSPGDLLTEAVESGWLDVNVYGEEDLENTPLDCRVCHQPDGLGTRKLLRMQETAAPWNHWFWRLVPGGRAVIDDYYAAKGDEPYAGVPADEIVESQPGLLSAALFYAGSGDQPNAFVSSQIEREVIESASLAGGNQPFDNSVPGYSATWHAIYDRANRGEAIAVPYHDVKTTDPGKLAAMTAAYTAYREGRRDRGALPDLHDIFPDDRELRAEIGLDTSPGLNGDALLLQACAQCHNERLDPALSRARFTADLRSLDRAAKDAAIARLRLPRDHSAAMPPARARQLTEDARESLIRLLER